MATRSILKCRQCVVVCMIAAGVLLFQLVKPAMAQDDPTYYYFLTTSRGLGGGAHELHFSKVIRSCPGRQPLSVHRAFSDFVYENYGYHDYSPKEADGTGLMHRRGMGKFQAKAEAETELVRRLATTVGGFDTPLRPVATGFYIDCGKPLPVEAKRPAPSPKTESAGIIVAAPTGPTQAELEARRRDAEVQAEAARLRTAAADRAKVEALVQLRNMAHPVKRSCKESTVKLQSTQWLWFYNLEPGGDAVIRARLAQPDSLHAIHCGAFTGGNQAFSVSDFKCVAEGVNADVYKTCAATITCSGKAKSCGSVSASAQ